MAAIIIDGKQIASDMRTRLKQEVQVLSEQGKRPGLSVILVGDNPASQSYVRGKEKACRDLGIYSIVERLPNDTTEAEILDKIAGFNTNPDIHGILVQLPLPNHISEQNVIEAISPQKDVDGFHVTNVGRLQTGMESLIPCTPHGVIQMLKFMNVPIKGKHVVIVGRSNIVGKPLAALFLAENATVTVCHSKTEDLKAFTKQADILIAAVGKPNLITAEMVKEGSVVIDVGINRLENGKLVGDVAFNTVKEVAGMITPVPGGVGPMTITMLLYNTIEAAKRA
jgi:methylenetetrahydrofolate dehydrogenase (NADP+) / methenyltetrahydrofolate cyclohydrolase